MAKTGEVGRRREWAESVLPEWFEFGPPGELMRAMRGGDIRLEEYREDGTLVIRAEAPGIDPEKDVDISIDRGMLRIRVERRQREESKTAEGYRSEFRYGAFSRTVPLPPGAAEKDIKASYTDGILEVRVPVPEGHEARKVSVQRGG
jgi:HSP20 family protein